MRICCGIEERGLEFDNSRKLKDFQCGETRMIGSSRGQVRMVNLEDVFRHVLIDTEWHTPIFAYHLTK